MTDAQIQAQPFMNDDKANGTYYAYHNENRLAEPCYAESTQTKNIYLKVTGGDNIARNMLFSWLLKMTVYS